MIELSGSDQKEFRKAKLSAFVLLVGAPLVYILVMLSVDHSELAETSNELMFYLLFVIAIIQPAVYLPIEKFQISSFHRAKNSKMSPAQLYFTLSVIKFSLVESSFIYGLVIYFITGELNNALYFYPVGAIWSFAYWPRENKFKKFLERVNSK